MIEEFIKSFKQIKIKKLANKKKCIEVKSGKLDFKVKVYSEKFISKHSFLIL